MPADLWQMELEKSRESLSNWGCSPSIMSGIQPMCSGSQSFPVDEAHCIYNADKKYIQQNLLMRFPPKSI